MKTIKFRAKRVDNGDWVYGNLRNDFYKPDVKTREMWTFIEVVNNEMGYVYPITVIPGTVGQFSGMKDKNGVEIYEYDIATLGKNPKVIKYFPKYGMFGFVGKSVYRQFDESEPMGSGGSSTRYKPYVLSEYYQKRMEIIGNIHDNPELINEIKK